MKASKSNKPKSTADPEKITWTKVMCFALAIAREHQRQPRKNGALVPCWKAILEIINAVWLQEFEDFRRIYPNGLSNPGKLRSGFSDAGRSRDATHWRFRMDQCTPEEIQEMNRIVPIVIAHEQRLSQLPGSFVVNPVNPVTWVTIKFKQPKTPAQKAEAAAKKRKRKDESEEEEEEEESEEHDDEEDEESEGSSSGQHVGTEECSDESDSRSQVQKGSDGDDDEDSIVVAGFSRTFGDDEDADRASDEDVPATRMAFRTAPPDLQNRPRKKLRFMNNYDGGQSTTSGLDHEHDQNYLGLGQYAPSGQLQQHFDAGLFEHNDFDAPATDLAHTGLVDNSLSGAMGASDADYASLLHQDPLFSGVDTLDQNLKSYSDDVVDEFDTLGAIGKHIDPSNLTLDRTEMLRRQKQSELNLRRMHDRNAIIRLPVRENPATQQLRDRYLNQRRPYYGDGHTETQTQATYENCRHTLIDGYRARPNHKTNLLVVLYKIPGFAVTLEQWPVETDFIVPMAQSTGSPHAHVREVVHQALRNPDTISMPLQRLLALPAKTDPQRDAPNGKLNTLVHQINSQPKMPMIHSREVDFSSGIPTCAIRAYPSDEQIAVSFAKNLSFDKQISFVPSNTPLYNQTGEVRRVVLQDQITKQCQEVDLMLCDAKICAECQTDGATFKPEYDYAHQRCKLPLVHHNDVLSLQDGSHYFAPTKQSLVSDRARVVQQDIRDVVFSGGRTCRVILCNKQLCSVCVQLDAFSQFKR